MKENERKFLLKNDDWNKEGICDKYLIEQRYLHIDDKKEIRVRLKGGNAEMTIKSTEMGSRDEIPLAIDYPEGVELCQKFGILNKIVKTRTCVFVNDKLWEIDVFADLNEGLVLAEAELENLSDHIDLPEWIGKEVTYDSRYYNANLAKTPFKLWRDK